VWLISPPPPSCLLSLSLSLSLCEKFSVILFDDEVQKHDMEASTEYGMKKKIHQVVLWAP
jgi:hypothetical protein